MSFEVRESADLGYFLVQRRPYSRPRLTFHSLGYLVVRVPKAYSDNRINKFINTHYRWITKHQPSLLVFSDSMTIKELHLSRQPNTGREVRLRWSGNTLYVYAEPEVFTNPLTQIQISKRLSSKLTKSAQAGLSQRVFSLAEIAGLMPKNVNVRPMTSRWGSCSTKGNLSINTYLVFLPEDLKDYVILHELAHLRHHDHSQAYWDFLAAICPDVKAKRRNLTTNFRTRILA